MSILQSQLEPSVSFPEETYDYQRINSYQPFNNEYGDSMNISNIPEICRIRTLFCGKKSSSINPNISFSPLRYFKEHCVVNQVSHIRKFSPSQQYCRNKTLINKKPMTLSGNITNNKNLVKSHSFIQHKENGSINFNSGISDKDNCCYYSIEKKNKESIANISYNTENFSNLIKEFTEQQNKKEIQKKQKVTYTNSFYPFSGFCAFTYKNQNEKALDKVDIGINKTVTRNAMTTTHKNENKINQTLYAHFFGLFQGMSSSNGSNYFKEKYRITLFKKENLITDPISAMFETHKEIESILNNSSKNNICDGVRSCILFTFNNKMYLLRKGTSKCIISLRNSTAVYSLVKVKSSRHLSRMEFLKMLGDTSTSSKQINSNKMQNNSHEPKSSHYFQDVLEISEIAMNNEIDFLLIMNENISNHLTYKECLNIIYKSILECQYKNVAYKQMLETVISNICIEATQHKAKSSLSVIFLPQERLKVFYEEGIISLTQEILQNIKDSPSSSFNSKYPLMKIHEDNDAKNTRHCTSASIDGAMISGATWTSMDETNLSLLLKNQRKKGFFCCGLFT